MVPYKKELGKGQGRPEPERSQRESSSESASRQTTTESVTAEDKNKSFPKKMKQVLSEETRPVIVHEFNAVCTESSMKNESKKKRPQKQGKRENEVHIYC